MFLLIFLVILIYSVLNKKHLVFLSKKKIFFEKLNKNLGLDYDLLNFFMFSFIGLAFGLMMIEFCLTFLILKLDYALVYFAVFISQLIACTFNFIKSVKTKIFIYLCISLFLIISIFKYGVTWSVYGNTFF